MPRKNLGSRVDDRAPLPFSCISLLHSVVRWSTVCLPKDARVTAIVLPVTEGVEMGAKREQALQALYSVQPVRRIDRDARELTIMQPVIETGRRWSA